MFFSLAFAASWDGFLVFWYATLIPQLCRSDGSREVLFALLFPLVFVVVGVWQTYSAIAALVNRTTLRVDTRTLEVGHHPLPWPGGRKLSLEGVRGFFVRKRGSLGEGSESCTVLADVGESATCVVLDGLSEEDARFVAARLAAHIVLDCP